MRQGRALERLVEIVERYILGRDEVEVESPKFLTDVTTGKKREHDVLITINMGHHSITISMECKDRKKPVGVPDVEAFWAKCAHTNVDKGVFVSTSGFTQSARKKSTILGIRCISLEEVETLPWLIETASLVEHTREFESASLTYIIEEQPSYPMNQYEFCDPDGKVISDEVIKGNLQLDSNKFPWDFENGWQTYTHEYRTEGCFLRHKEDGETIAVPGLLMDVRFLCTVKSTPFDQKVYQDGITGESIAEIAVAQAVINGKQKKVMILDDGELRSLRVSDAD